MCALYRDIKDSLYQAPGVAERCLLTGMSVIMIELSSFECVYCRLFGDQMEIDFWMVAAYYLSREQARMKDPSYKVRS